MENETNSNSTLTTEQISDQLKSSLANMKEKTLLWLEILLAYHGILLEEVDGGINSTQMSGKQEKVVTKRIPKLRVLSTVIHSLVAQLSKDSPEFVGVTNRADFQEIADTLAKFLEQKFRYADVTRLSPVLMTNAALFGEAIIKYNPIKIKDSEDSEGSEDSEDSENSEELETSQEETSQEETSQEETSQEVESLTPFELLVSADWKDSIQDVSWVATRKSITIEEARVLYPIKKTDSVETESLSVEDYYPWGTVNSLVINPAVFTKNIYHDKVEPSVIANACGLFEDTGTGYSSEDYVEVYEYWNKTVGIHVKLVGNTEIFREDFSGSYPISAVKLSYCPVTYRGISPAEAALPLIKAMDRLNDLKMEDMQFNSINYALVDEKLLRDGKIALDRNTIISVPSLPGQDSNLDAIKFVHGYSNSFDYDKTIAEYANRIYGLFGVSQFISGSPARDTLTAREATIKNMATSSNLDYIIRRVERELYGDIAQRMIESLPETTEAGEILGYVKSKGDKYFVLLPEAEIEDEDDREVIKFEWNGETCSYYRPKVNIRLLNKVLKKKDDFEIPEDILEEDEIKSWAKLEAELYKESSGLVAKALIRQDLEKVKFEVSSVTGALVSKQIIIDKLQSVAQSMAITKKDPSFIFDRISRAYGIPQEALEGGTLSDSVLAEYLQYIDKEEGTKAEEAPDIFGGDTQGQTLQGQTLQGQTPQGMNGYNMATQDAENNTIFNPNTIAGGTSTVNTLGIGG